MEESKSIYPEKCLKLDFHIHSCHSSCGSLDMSPKNVISALLNKNIRIASITDHNSIKNSKAYINFGLKNGICIFPGCEIQTEEEIHLVVIFYNLTIAQKWQNWIDQIIPKIKLDPDLFGDEPIVDEEENILELPEYLYSVSLPVSFDELEKKALEDNLIFFPSHINASSNSIISQLGFFPQSHLFTIAEITNEKDYDLFTESNPELILITNSDAHYLNQIGLRYNCIYSDELLKLYEEFLFYIQKQNNLIFDDFNNEKIEDLRIKIFFAIKNLFTNKISINNKFSDKKGKIEKEVFFQPIFNL
ncbi:MAG: PHP domain-containing protein [Exilispira sp.]